MARRLEQHLFQSAKTKEEYRDETTLRARLQLISREIEISKVTRFQENVDGTSTVTSRGTKSSVDSQSKLRVDGSSTSSKSEVTFLNQEQFSLARGFQDDASICHDPNEKKQQALNIEDSRQSPLEENISIATPLFSQDALSINHLSIENSSKVASRKHNESENRRILSQQQRLLLLRHASKCQLGRDCHVKNCDKVVPLWRHMQQCMDKSCKIAHCFSSRRVLNHYLICKSQNKTSTCEVCGPVMKRIKKPLSPNLDDELLVPDNDTAPQVACIPGSEDSIQTTYGGSDILLGQSQGFLSQINQSNVFRHKHLTDLDGKEVDGLQMVMDPEANCYPAPIGSQEKVVSDTSIPSTIVEAKSPSDAGLKTRKLDDISPVITSNLKSLDTCQDTKVESTSSVSIEDKSTDNSLSHSVRDGSMISRRSYGKGKTFESMENEILQDQKTEKTESVPFDDCVPLSNASPSPKQSNELPDGDSIPPTKQKKKISNSIEPTAEGNEGSPPEEQREVDSQSTSLIPFMSRSSIHEHLFSLEQTIELTPRAISQKNLPIIRRLIDDKFGWIFRDPVDPIALKIPDYFNIIKRPMHLSLIEQKLENWEYKHIKDVAVEVQLVFKNAILYNGPDSDLGKVAAGMIKRFEKDFQNILIGKTYFVTRIFLYFFWSNFQHNNNDSRTKKYS
jgi:Bromodomain/TAZ zinc finger